MKDYLLFDRKTQAIVYNRRRNPIQRMLDFDTACGRETPSVAAIVNPTGEGKEKFFFGDIRSFPSYLQVGPSFGIEKSKRRMIAEDIRTAMSLLE